MYGLLLTCEHASNHVPAAFQPLFRSSEATAALESHRGYDEGAWKLAQKLARAIKTSTKQPVPLVPGAQSRLLIDLNRTNGHRHLFSEYSHSASLEKKTKLLAIHASHHAKVRALVKTQRGRVLHIGIHSFTPVLDGKKRTTDFGLLYDPRRAPEAALAGKWSSHLRQTLPLVIHRNAPYRGQADGLTTLLRREFSPKSMSLSSSSSTSASCAARTIGQRWAA
jgi:predicted N-formylglutamate amidohydrolase